jgi:hypothetical protein
MIVEHFLVTRSMVEISHSPFSPHFMPASVFVFPKVTTILKDKRFQDVKDVQKKVTSELNAVSLDTFDNCFVHPLERCNNCYHERR